MSSKRTKKQLPTQQVAKKMASTEMRESLEQRQIQTGSAPHTPQKSSQKKAVARAKAEAEMTQALGKNTIGRDGKRRSGGGTEDGRIQKPAWATVEADKTERSGAAITPHEEPLPMPPRLSPWQRLRRRALLITTGRLIGGLITLGILFLLLTSGQTWTALLFAWVLLSILADEFDGWFGYIGALMGLLTLFGPFATGDPEWQTLLPLVGCALLALLIVKHSGGPLVLPFAAAVFILPLYAAANYGEILDSNLILVANPELLHTATVAVLVGLSISLVRQSLSLAVKWSAVRAERRELQAE